MIRVIVVKVEWYGFTLPECNQKGGHGTANSIDSDQTAPCGLHCLLTPICPNTYNFYGKTFHIIPYIVVYLMNVFAIATAF